MIYLIFKNNIVLAKNKYKTRINIFYFFLTIFQLKLNDYRKSLETNNKKSSINSIYFWI